MSSFQVLKCNKCFQRFALGASSFLLVGLLAACSDTGTDPLQSASMTVISGNAQVGAVAVDLPQPVVVKVVDGSGHPVRGALVRWTVVEGGGSTDSLTTATDNNGQASVRWTLGADNGAQTLKADAGNASANIRATAVLRFSAVAGGYLHTCAIATNGLAYCWGSNSRGQLGDGSLTSSSKPVALSLQLRFKALALGWTHSCGLTVGGAVFCWGENAVGTAGSPGSGNVYTPRHIALTEAFVSISAGYHHTCGVTEAGKAYCWGENDYGQLGTAATVNTCEITFIKSCTPIPQPVAVLTSAKSIAADEFHTCAVADGSAYCWGLNSYGELGNDQTAYNAIVPQPQKVTGGRPYQVVAPGVRHTCALNTSGKAECWGLNIAGEIGMPAGQSTNFPYALPGTLVFKLIGTGYSHTCAIATDDRVYCWGSLLGNGTDLSSATPVPSTLGPAKSIGVGYQHACAVDSNGDVWCWGLNSDGQLGVSGVASSNVPVRVQTP